MARHQRIIHVDRYKRFVGSETIERIKAKALAALSQMISEQELPVA